ncbi:60S ribosomal protein L31-like [Scyliorhinus canicula]|uniref:60S ribosomal protein L31-like n=1 Tax=Scyliorhinus canicula TaxID=7830 RepID=UPI0018F5A661|nr:60S ribosomal protein L31-like [Scyliorhinus canicula]
MSASDLSWIRRTSCQRPEVPGSASAEAAEIRKQKRNWVNHGSKDHKVWFLIPGLNVWTARSANTFEAGWYGVVRTWQIPFECINELNATLVKTIPLSEPSTSAPAGKGGEKQKGRTSINKVVTREYTINVHKRIHGIGFKERAPCAIKEIRKCAVKKIGTPDVRNGICLNMAVWAKGVKNVPYCIRVGLSRKRNKGVDFPNKLYTLVTYVPVTSYKGLQTFNVDEN